MSAVRQLQVASRMESITQVEGLINALCEEFGVEETHYGEILIAMTEAVNNAVVHGNKLDTNKMVDIEVRTEGQTMEFRIADQGPGFDYENIPDPTAPENIEKPNGRGVFLMRQLADTCEFEELGRVAILRFEQAIPQPATAQ
ncbi:MAG: ATP-binding protein [Crocinitomicaceae bacterium]|nr:ATP-binding protein [Crocinitomicaceae bacterium]